MRQLPHEISFLSPLNFEMPCLAIADNPRKPSWKAHCAYYPEHQDNTRSFKAYGLILNTKKDVLSYLT